jgi:hypothetical protein
MEGCEEKEGARAGRTIFERWLPIIKDVRTALAADPLPMETVKELLAAA